MTRDNPFIPSLELNDEKIEINMKLNELKQELKDGAKFIYFEYTISAIAMTFRRSSKIYFIKSDEGKFGKVIRFSLISLLLGWWAVPWGPIYTIGSIFSTLNGGKDITEDITDLYDELKFYKLS
jgi:hypothetical protein